MRPKLTTVVLLLMLSTSCACSQEGRVEDRAFGLVLENLLSHSVNEMSVDEADSIAGTCRFIDARERKEYDVSHLEGAVWVGYDDFDIARMAGIAKGDSIVVYCSVGYRSEQIAEKLKAAGYRHVWNLYGGIFEWKNRDLPVVGPDGKPTERVHAFDKSWGRWLEEGEKVYDGEQ